MKSATASAPGKLIISGEHAVVYNQPALVTSLNLTLTVTLTPTSSASITDPYINHIIKVHQHFSRQTIPSINWTINSQIPQKSGFGSSAALASAFHQALAKLSDTNLDKETLYQLVQESEKYIHGNPSGIDAAATTYGGVFVYQRTNSGQPTIKPLDSSINLPNFLVIQSGSAIESTKEMVEQVAAIPNNRRRPIIKKLGQATKRLINQLNANKPIYLTIRQNQHLLNQLGVVGFRAQQITDIIENFADAAKISGAGGNSGGSGAILAFHPNLSILKRLIEKHSWPLITFQSTPAPQQT